MARSHLSHALAATVRELRLTRGSTQESLAECAGITAEYVSRLERGLSSPTFAVLEALSRPLGMRVSQLIDVAERRSPR